MFAFVKYINSPIRLMLPHVIIQFIPLHVSPTIIEEIIFFFFKNNFVGGRGRKFGPHLAVFRIYLLAGLKGPYARN